MDSSKRIWLVIGVAVLLLLSGGTVWAFYALRTSEPAPAPAVVEMNGAMKELTQDLRDGKSLENKTELLAKMAKMGQEMRDLSPEQRKLAMKNFGMVATDYMKNYFQLSKEEQTKQLDSVLNMFQLAEKMGNLFGGRRNRDAQGEGQGAEAGGNQGAADRGQARFNGGPDGKMTPEKRDAWQREMISSMSTPEQRAMFAEYGRQLRQRAQERGMQLKMRAQ
jgi:hypothetical protein